jgi:threonine/homoserine/homoserine lactone efflux protein
MLVWAAGSFAGLLKRNEAIARWQNKVVGGIHIALGLQLALQERR